MTSTIASTRCGWTQLPTCWWPSSLIAVFSLLYKPSVKRDNCGMLAALDAGRGKIVRSHKAFGFQEILVVSERANHARSEMWIQNSGMGRGNPPFQCIRILRMGTRGPLKKPELWRVNPTANSESTDTLPYPRHSQDMIEWPQEETLCKVLSTLRYGLCAGGWTQSTALDTAQPRHPAPCS